MMITLHRTSVIVGALIFAAVGGIVWAGTPMTPVGDAGGGATGTHILSTASTNSNLIKATGGTLYGGTVINTNAATAYLKFYNKATAPTCASDTVTLTFALVQNIPVRIELGVAGVLFRTGLGLCITGAAADSDNTNATTGITLSIVYK